ncbi:MAG: ATPase, T2SS/T4P/T4SS family, partial [Pseudomonadota bacterium]
MDSDPQQRLGDALIAAGKLSAAALERAQRLSGAGRGSLPAMLASLGMVGERDLAEALAATLGLPLLTPEGLPTEPVAIDALSPKFLRDRRLLPLRPPDGGLAVAVADPFDLYALGAVEMATGAKASLHIAEAGLIERALERLYADALEPGANGLAELDAPDSDEPDIERLRDQASEAPVIRLVNGLIARAVEAQASDIHIEPFERQFRVRFRIDGVLQRGEDLPEAFRAAVVSRIKIMARLDIAERRLPQDGRIKTVVRGRAIDLRVATMPILHGEAVVIRVLDRESAALDFETLGVREPARARLAAMIAEPHGIVLVTGPTGSGKTTTLYAALSSIVSDALKILTVEDPVEYQLAGVNQV